MYAMGKEGREKLGSKCQDYVKSEFSYENTINLWHDSLLKLIKDWENGKSTTRRFDLTEI